MFAIIKPSLYVMQCVILVLLNYRNLANLKI